MSRTFEGNRLKPLKKVGDKRYQAQAVVGPRAADRKYRTFQGTKGECNTQAEAWFAKIAAQIATKAELDLRGRREQPLSLYLESWLESKRDAIKDNTYQRYDSCIRLPLVPALGDVRLCGLSPQHVRDYIAACKREPSTRNKGHKVSNKTIRNRVGVLSAAIADAMDDQPPLLKRDPIAPLRGRGRRKGFSPASTRA